jgi:hypothetical protein
MENEKIRIGNKMNRVLPLFREKTLYYNIVA